MTDNVDSTRKHDFAASKQKGEKKLPIRSEYITEGSMGRITRGYYADGDSRIFKIAKNPSFNINLKDEYTFMMFLGDKSKTPSIPYVYEEFPPSETVATFGFSMEDLKEFKGLLDLHTNTDISTLLNTDDKMLILSDVISTLEYANAQGVVYNDVQLQNIMTDGTSTKLVDWGNAKWTDEQNRMNDINQTASMIPRLFNQHDFVPPLIQKWISAVESKQLPDPSTAWTSLKKAWGDALVNESQEVEKLRAEVYGRNKKETIFKSDILTSS